MHAGSLSIDYACLTERNDQLLLDLDEIQTTFRRRNKTESGAYFDDFWRYHKSIKSATACS